MRPAQVAAGIASTALGLTVACAWALRDESLTRVHPLFLPMPYTLAVGLLLCGLALLARAGGWLRLAGVSASMVFTIGVSSLLQQALGLRFGLYPVLDGLGDGAWAAMTPSSALSLVLVGVGLVAASVHPLQGSFACAISGTTVAVQRGVAFVGSSFGIAGSYLVTGSAPLIDVGLAVVGIGTIAAAWDRGHDATERAPRWLPLPVALGMALISVSLWYQSASDQRMAMEESTKVRVEQLGVDLGRRASPYADALVHLAEAEAARRRGTALIEPRALAVLDLERYPGFSAIALIDLDLNRRWIEPQQTATSLLPGLDGERIRHVLRESGDRHAPRIIDAVHLPSGRSGFLIGVPVFDEGRPVGFVVGAFTYERFFSSTIGPEEGTRHPLQVFEGQRVLFRQGSGESLDMFSAVAPLRLLGATWWVQSWATRSPTPHRSFADGSLVFGLAFAGLLGWTVWLSQSSARRRDQLASAIIARDTAQAAQAQTEWRYKQIIDAAADIIYRTDARGRFVFVNPAAVRVTKWSRDELIGREYLSLIRPDRQADVRAFYETQVAEQLPTTYLDFPAVRADGQEVWIGQHVQLLMNGNEVVGFQAVARDISDRIRVQHELQRMRDSALETARLKSEFVANTSHEVRTPLNGILGFSNLLLDTDLSEEQHTYVNGLKVSAEALLAIINDILDLSKVEAGMLALETVSFDLRTTIDHSVIVQGEAARQRQLAFTVQIDARLPRRVKGDPSRLRQVLSNLIANAIKFTDNGSITVTVEVASETEREAVVRFSIRDTGIGIDPEARHRLFQPFVQADGTTSRRYGGTGLGLAISRQIVELFGGSISVDSVPGSGSTFSFTVRLEKDTDAALNESVIAPSLEGVSALIVVDTPSLREELVRCVTDWGVLAGRALNVNDALERLRAAAADGRPYQVAIVALVHPQEDAMALARSIKAHPATNPVKVVLIPLKGVVGDAKAAREAGIAAYLPRPVDPDDLLRCLRSILCAPSDTTDAERTSQLVTRHVLEERRNAARHRILVTDDHPVSLQVTRLLVERLGPLVDTATNGAEAVQAASRNTYALILMDLQMPVLDGYSATAEIRRNEGSGPRTPIVAFTASAGPYERQRCLEAGMDDVLEKPIRDNELADLLRRWLPTAATHESDPVTQDPVRAESADMKATMALELELGPEVWGQLIDRYAEHTEGALRRMEDATGDDHVAELVQEAHRLRGSSMMLGFVRVGALCADLEHEAHRFSQTQRQQAVSRLKSEWTELGHSRRKRPDADSAVA